MVIILSMLQPKVFETLLRSILKLERNLCAYTINKRCRSHIGVSFEVCADVWNRITTNGSIPEKAMPKHLLWTLNFMFLYETDNVLATRWEADTKTLKKWIWAMIDSIMTLKKEVVSLFSIISKLGDF